MVNLSALSSTNPILFRGQAYYAEKCYWYGAQKAIDPNETLARIKPLFPKIGLTRLADITGLDCIGIPVVLSMRPNSGYLSVDAGKGFTVTAAAVSAAMECFERHAAETTRPPEFRATYQQIQNRYKTIPLKRLPLSKNSLFHPQSPERWTLIWDLMQQEDVAVPTMMVTMERHRCPRSELISFQLSSNGLSAGNHFLEAVYGGILEVIERDAIACQQLAWESHSRAMPRVRLETITHPQVLELLSRFEAADVEVVLFDCTIDTDVPVYMAYIFDRHVRKLGIYKGYGCHLDPGIAMVRALTEAAQGRLVFIAGSRDDTFRHHQRLRYDTDETAIATLRIIKPTVDAQSRFSEATPTFEGDIQLLLKKLVRVGLTQVLVADLTVPEVGINVVRVIVPGLEGYRFETYTPGERAQAFLKGISS